MTRRDHVHIPTLLLVWLILAVAIIMIFISLASAAPSPGSTTPPPQTTAPVPPPSATFPVQLSAQDGLVIKQVCSWAMDSQQDLGVKTRIGQFCIELLTRIEGAQRGVQAEHGAHGTAHDAHDAEPTMPRAKPR